MNKARRENRTRRADGMAMRNRAAFDVDDVVREPELLRDCERHGSKRLVDLDAFDIAEYPARAFKRDLHGRHRAKTEHAWLDSGDAECRETRGRFDAVCFRVITSRDDHR